MILNINVGLLGHVNSGKTTLAQMLSSISSTAAFDKHPSSRERGITLDLGFSALIVDTPEHLKDRTSAKKLQFTFVDCPGHSSLIRTIIGGCQIIDIMILVVDVRKGIQTQTAECLVIGEITCRNLIIVINKIDLLLETETRGTIDKLKTKLRKILNTTSFGGHVPIYTVSALSGRYIPEFVESLKSYVTQIPVRKSVLPFLFSVDHCFALKGHGTICTGTVLQGKICVGDSVEIPMTKEVRRIKTIQVFHKPVQTAQQGDRAGLCLSNFNANFMERGILAQKGLVVTAYAAVTRVNKIRYYKYNIRSKCKLHITIGHSTVMGRITLFRPVAPKCNEFLLTEEYEYLDEMKKEEPGIVFALIEFETPVLSHPNSLVIVSKLDMNNNSNACRIAFWGYSSWITNSPAYSTECLPNFKIYKCKSKKGSVLRAVNVNELIVQNLFKSEGKRNLYMGKTVRLSTGEEGIIDTTFGQTNKVKVRFMRAISDETLNLLKKKDNDITVLLNFKKFIFNKNIGITQ